VWNAKIRKLPAFIDSWAPPTRSAYSHGYCNRSPHYWALRLSMAVVKLCGNGAGPEITVKLWLCFLWARKYLEKLINSLKPNPSNYYTLSYLQDRPNLPFLITSIRALWRSAMRPERLNVKNCEAKASVPGT